MSNVDFLLTEQEMRKYEVVKNKAALNALSYFG